MSEHSGGIVFTRTVELPFPPFDKLHLFSVDFEECPIPPGFPLKNVAWDLDRKCFLATSEMTFCGPIFEIPMTLQCIREKGWRLGSYQEHYPAFDESDDETSSENVEGTGSEMDWDELESLEKVIPRMRPKWFNQIVKALVRSMVEAGDDLAAAYALDRTGFVFTRREAAIYRDHEEKARVWESAYREYDDLGSDDWNAWRRRVKRYKNLHRIAPIKLR